MSYFCSCPPSIVFRVPHHNNHFYYFHVYPFWVSQRKHTRIWTDMIITPDMIIMWKHDVYIVLHLVPCLFQITIYIEALSW